MNGFKDDVISILRDNVLLHAEAMGWIMGDRELLEELESRKLPVTERNEKPVFLFDYIVIPSRNKGLHTLLAGLAYLSHLGILILEITGAEKTFDNHYKSFFGDFVINKLKYGDRAYLVFHKGVDYGN